MGQYWLIVRSVTYAQRLQRMFLKAGLRTPIFRAPMELTGGRGCLYAVQVAEKDLADAMTVIRRGNLSPDQIFYKTSDGFQEVTV